MPDPTHYRIAVRPRPGGYWGSYRRDGREFAADAVTVLPAEEVSQALHEDAYLHIEPCEAPVAQTVDEIRLAQEAEIRKLPRPELLKLLGADAKDARNLAELRRDAIAKV